MKYLYGIICFFVLMYASMPLWADKYDHHYYPEPQVTNVYETYEVTQVVNATDEQVAAAMEAINPTTYSYSPDECQGVAIAQAGANNTMYMGTTKPQLSLGVGECDGELASSLMFGMRVNNQLMLNGSWATDESISAFGVGATVIFK